MQQNKYDKEPLTAVEAQRLAQEIAFGPIVFQVSRLMLKFGIFQLLADERKGMTQEEISKACGLSSYGAQVLLEASLTIGTVLLREGRYCLAKAGWFLLNDKWYVSIWTSTMMLTIRECFIWKKPSPTDVLKD